MTISSDDPFLNEARRQVEARYETIPWLDGLYMPHELEFRPLPEEMLDLLEASEDFAAPSPGNPELLTIFSNGGEAGMLIWLHPTTGATFAMVPVKERE